MDLLEIVRQELINEGHNCTEILIYMDGFKRFSIRGKGTGLFRSAPAFDDTLASVVLHGQTNIHAMIYSHSTTGTRQHQSINLDLTDPNSIPKLIECLQSLLPT